MNVILQFPGYELNGELKSRRATLSGGLDRSALFGPITAQRFKYCLNYNRIYPIYQIFKKALFAFGLDLIRSRVPL